MSRAAVPAPASTVAVRMARLPISTVLADTISTLTPTALKKGVALEIDVAPDLISGARMAGLL